MTKVKEKEEGMKFDNGKLRYDLIPPEAKKWLAEILTFGAAKYTPNSWQGIEIDRYLAAMERHINDWRMGIENDEESGLHHLKHALCNMMFITWIEITKKPIEEPTGHLGLICGMCHSAGIVFTSKGIYVPGKIWQCSTCNTVGYLGKENGELLYNFEKNEL